MRKSPRTIEWIRRLLDDPERTVVFHHAKFDLKMFSFEGIDIFNIRAQVDCTLILAKLFNMSYNSYELRFLAKYLLRRTTEDKDEIKEWLKSNSRSFEREHGRKPNFSDAPDEVLKKRVLWDVESTLLLHRMLKRKVMSNCSELYQTERDLMFVCIDMENTGVRVDLTRAKQLKQEAEQSTTRILQDIRNLVGDIDVPRKKKGERIIEHVPGNEFNPGSNAHLEAAFRKVGIKLQFKTKPKKGKKGKPSTGGGNWSFDEYAMVRYVSPPLASIIRDSSEEGWPIDKFYDAVHETIRKHKLMPREMIPPLVLKYREVTKMVSTYYDHIIEQSVDVQQSPTGRETGILHCLFNQSEAMTGRFSSSNPNMQNMPRILGPRECFIPRKGRRNFHFDYEQVEMKFFCHFARDRSMAEAIEDDIHQHVAEQIYNVSRKDVTKERRKRAKAINFGIIYGSGPGTMAETLTKRGIPTRTTEAAYLVANYHRTFPSVKRITNDLKRALTRDGYVTNPFGRRYYIPIKLSYKALNYLCQGTPADLLKRAMVAIWKWLRKMGLKSKILKTIHDELVLEIPRSEEQIVVTKVVELMQDLTTYFVPITVDVEVVNKRWSKKEKYELPSF